MKHELKCWPQYFEALYVKTFELRLDDRGYQKGDVLHLREWDPQAQAYTGRECLKEVTYLLEQGAPGLALGYVGLGLGPWSGVKR
jgi:hypothetical protein